MATVRLGDDLNGRVKAAAARAGVSVTVWVAEACEARLGGRPVLPAARSARDDCRHPVGRRIGATCMACGAPVARK